MLTATSPRLPLHLKTTLSSIFHSVINNSPNFIHWILSFLYHSSTSILLLSVYRVLPDFYGIFGTSPISNMSSVISGQLVDCNLTWNISILQRMIVSLNVFWRIMQISELNFKIELKITEMKDVIIRIKKVTVTNRQIHLRDNTDC